MTPTSPAPRAAWPDYKAVWRWHFYASLFCMPFVVVLAVSGGIYLFKPQVEAWNERVYERCEFSGPPATAAAQIQAAVAALPGGVFSSYELPPTDESAARVIVRQHDQNVRVYVHPQTLEVLGTVLESERFMRFIFRLHGELLLGDRGSMLVELAASWTIVMVLTGLFLWWPRQSRGLAGVFYPRWREGSRVLWRDLHSVTGVWISLFTLFLLLSGLPWAKSWGNYLKAVRRLTGTAVARQDWPVGAERPAEKSARAGAGEDHSGHGGSGRRRGEAGGGQPVDVTPVDRIAATVRPLGLESPVVIAPPAGGGAQWTAKSVTANRPWRVNLVVDGATGAIVSREDFQDRHWIDRLVQVGIAAHEGQLFGWPNQVLGLLTALGLVLLCGSGVVLWWRRREPGTLGAPRAGAAPRFSGLLCVLVVALGVYLPLFGSTLIATLLLEWLVLRRIPRVNRWLGLERVSPRSA